MNLRQAIILGDLKKLKQLSPKLNLNQEIENYTPLILAVIYQQVEIVVFLLTHGAEPNFTDEDGKTALMYSHDLEITFALLQYGADVNIQDNDGNTALLYNADNFPIIEILLKYGADINHINYSGQTALIQNVNNNYITDLLFSKSELNLALYHQARRALIEVDDKTRFNSLLAKHNYKIEPFISDKQSYNYLKTLGAGIMGVVVLVRGSDHKLYALKITAGIYHQPNYEINDAEIIIANYLMNLNEKSKHLVHFYDSYVEEYGLDKPHFNYIIMEYIIGINPIEIYEKYEISNYQAIKWVIELLEALNFLNSNLILDFDVNISNVIIQESNLSLKLYDLGLACFKEQYEPNCQNYQFSESIYINVDNTINGLVDFNSDMYTEIHNLIYQEIVNKHYDLASEKLRNYYNF